MAGDGIMRQWIGGVAVVVMAVHILKQTPNMLTQGVVHTQRRGLGRPSVRRRLCEQVGDAAIIDLRLLPGRLGEEAGKIGLVSTVQDTAGDIAQAFVGQDDQTGEILLKVLKLAAILKQVLEGDRVRRHERRGCDNRQLHPPLPFPTTVC